MTLYEILEENSCLRYLNRYVKKNNIHNVINEHDIQKLIRYLKKLKKSNVLILGEPGIGKTALVETLAELINKNEVPDFLKGKKILELSLGGAVAGTKYRGEFEEKIQNILNILEKRKDIILFIDEIHNMLKAGGAEGAIPMGDMLKPFMGRGQITVIGSTTKKEYQKTIKKDAAMNRRFSKINMLEPDILKTIEILNSVKTDYEKHYNVELNDFEIRNVALNSKFKKGKFPDKALDALESYCYEKGDN